MLKKKKAHNFGAIFCVTRYFPSTGLKVLKDRALNTLPPESAFIIEIERALMICSLTDNIL